MFNSIESRGPFVDNRIIDFASELDSSEKNEKKYSQIFFKKFLEKTCQK